ncbi:MAG: hypothetical protein AAGH92_01465 [Planctomycetota bacterium]
MFAIATGLSAEASEPPGTWSPVPLVSQALRDAGVRIGGEGAQWPQSIEVAPASDDVGGDFALFLTDVGGVYRSLDGGRTWEPTNVGFTPRGANDAAFDPHFPHRVVMSGMNTMGSAYNGLYLSEDRAASWTPVQREAISGHEDARQKLVFDPTTRDDEAGLTRVVYWSRTAEVRDNHWGEIEYAPGLYRSDDGGRTWSRLNDAIGEVAGHSAIDVVPSGEHAGRLLAGNDRGVFVSDDRGETFVHAFAEPVTSLAACPTRPGVVYATQATAVLLSEDAGVTWTTLSTTGLDEPIADEAGPDAKPGQPRTNVRFNRIAVSPADSDRLLMSSRADDWRWLRHVSHDAGRSWQTVRIDNALAFFPQNAREGAFAWHPTDPDVVLSFGGDWPTRSEDGGRTFRWSAEGQNAVYSGSPFAFNPHHAGLLFIASQDYNGGVTRDGGHTWTYPNVSGFGWGGFVYGGLAITPDIIVGGHADGGWSNPRVLHVSRDGGKTWTADPAVQWKHDRAAADFAYDAGFVHPTEPNVAFLADHRTDDAGETWRRMAGVCGVFAADESGTLYGVQRLAETDSSQLVRSTDAGETWETIVEVPGYVDDLAVTPDARWLYLASRDRLWKLYPGMNPEAVLGDPLVLVQTQQTDTGRHRVVSVAVDPTRPNRLYAGQRMDIHASSHGVLMSDDGGATWTNLNRTTPLARDEYDPANLDGGREPQFLRVDPHTGELWATTGCYGVWKFVPSD